MDAKKILSLSEIQFGWLGNNGVPIFDSIYKSPFYLALKNNDRKIYDDYFYNIDKVYICKDSKSDYDYFLKLKNSIEDNYDKKSTFRVDFYPNESQNRRKFKLNKFILAKDKNYYTMADGSHRCAILAFLYTEVNFLLKETLGSCRSSTMGWYSWGDYELCTII